MLENSAPVDGLDELFELNRLFLISLGNELRRGGNRFALPPAAARLMRCAPAELLEGLAEYPQALFDLKLDALPGRGVNDPAATRADPAARALNLTLLVSAWNMSRRSDYAARLFLRLSSREIRALRTTPLSDLPGLSQLDHLVVCAFRKPSWLWCRLLTEERPEYRRRLLLLGLQPHVEVNRSAIPGVRASM